MPDAALRLRPADLAGGPGGRALTDLASVPVPVRWFVGTYGVHTATAPLHDRLVGSTGVPGVGDADADRLFRRTLEALGVPFLRRRLMWAAVAVGYSVYWLLEKGLAVVIHAFGEEPLQGRDPMPQREF